MIHLQPALNYELGELSPYISEETM